MAKPLIQYTKDLLAYETGAVYKPHGGKIKIALAYPNTYHVGMSNLGFQLIYHLLNQRSDTVCERVFLPPPAYCRSNIPLFSLESQIPVKNFDLLAFSVSFEGDYPNILNLLKLAHIEPAAAKRSEYDPLVIMGGVCAYMNPEVLAPVMDGFILGEGEEVIDRFIDCLKEIPPREDRKKILKHLSVSVSSFYAPSLYNVEYNSTGCIKEIKPLTDNLPQLQISYIKNLNERPVHSYILTPNTEFKNIFLVELSRGCAHRCRFCMVGRSFAGYRYRSLDAVLEYIKIGLGLNKKIGLVGAAVTDYPYLNEVCRFITDKGAGFTVASLRADKLSSALLCALSASGHKTISIAPEAGSKRLRRLINKGLTEDDILNAVDNIKAHNIPNIKLYFMWGLPDETTKDISAIIALAGKIRQLMNEYDNSGLLTVSLSPFVPKPQTPFERYGFESQKSLKHKLAYLLEGLKKVKGIRILHDSIRLSFYQALFSKGDRRVGEALLTAYKQNMDWKVSLAKMNPPADFFVYRRRNSDEKLPWDHLLKP